MQYSQCTANDGCTLAYQTSLPPAADDPRRRNTCILLMHGFSGSSAYFEKNVVALSENCWVVAPDMRGHGRSGRTRGGYHVARLAADLKDLIAHLRREASGSGGASDGDSGTEVRFVPVGCSVGAAVLWTYVELFGGDDDFTGFVFVDQAPLQDRSPFGGGGGNGDEQGGAWDESKAHRGCYDEATMLAAQQAWTRDPAAARKGLVADCLGYRVAPEPGKDDLSDGKRAEDEAFFTSISAQCDPVWLARLLADHTRYDHREAIEEGIAKPTLVLAGRRTGCFPLEGMKETVRRIERRRGPGMAEFVVFESGHWLFWEEPERFSEVVVEFVRRCTE